MFFKYFIYNWRVLIVIYVVLVRLSYVIKFYVNEVGIIFFCLGDLTREES